MWQKEEGRKAKNADSTMIRVKRRRLSSLVLLACYCSTAVAFLAPLPLAASNRKYRQKQAYYSCSQFRHESRKDLQKAKAATGLNAAVVAVPEVLRAVGIKKVLFSVVGAALLYLARSRRLRRFLFWPGVRPDPAFSEPLPPSSLGCPFFGSNVLAGSQKKGPEKFYREASERLGHPRLWIFYFLGTPVASITGAALVQKLLAQEFSALAPETGPEQPSTKKKKRPRIFGTDNLLFERNKDRHAFLRRLVGAGMTPSALRQALPTIQQTAQNCVDQFLADQKEKEIPMEDVCLDYTLEITQRQLLGLDELPASEQVVMREQLKIWLSAIFSLAASLSSRIPFLLRRLKPFKARQYIEAKLEEKIDSLLRKGPDTSTLSNMLFATDQESQNAKLSRNEVVDNSLLLVAAGTENTASTMTLAFLLLGLHPDAYKRLVDEQHEFQTRHGNAIPTPELLDKECPYLDAVVKEALRLGAVSGGFARRARETLIIDGKQIPKGWPIFPNIRLTHQLDPVSRLPDDSHMDARKGFVPERWLDPETTPTDFIPFGAGPRYCLGADLSMLEMKVFLAMFCRSVPSFRLVGENTNGEIKWNPRTMVPRAADGVQVELLDTASVVV